MPINLEKLRAILKSTGINVYRDDAPSNANYPYIIYEFVNEQHKRASRKVFADMPLYQVAYITSGIESELSELKRVMNENCVEYASFTSAPYDENDLEITQFITYVRCVNEQ